MRIRLNLRLLVLLDLRSSPTVLPSLLSTPVETNTGPSKTHCHLVPAKSHLTAYFEFLLRTPVCFWWTWAESNRRPRVLRFEGITTIS